MDSYEIVEGLRLTAKLMELHGENPFKVRSLSNAAFQLSKSGTNLMELTEEEIVSLPGIGKGIAGKITELKNKGTTEELESLRSKTPVGVIRMLDVKGLGAKKVALLWKELQIEDPGELLYACRENRLVELKGFGEKTQAEIRKNLEYRLQHAGSLHFATVERLLPGIIKEVRKRTEEEEVEPVGTFRRKMETVPGLELLVCTSRQLSEAWEENGFRISYHSHPKEGYWKEVIRRSSSEAFLEELGTLKDAASEQDVFEASGLAFVPAEYRETAAAARQSRSGKIPDLITEEHLKGCLHNHSDWSDGTNTLEEMANACAAAGLEYFGICDHSRTASYAGGLSIEEVIQQQAEVDALNEKNKKFRIFKGIESDILNDGSLDYPDEVLKTFDFVVASVHQNLKMDEKKAMQRLLKAIENPYTRILGHPTGRLLLSRPGYPVDHRKIIDACAANGVVMELNANPWRLDIDWRWISYCIEKGVLISINPDAHEVDGIRDMRYGVITARKGGLTAEGCLNARSLKEFTQWIRNK